MANTVHLNVGDSSQVMHPQKVSVLTAEPNTWLLIYSGVALQRQRAEGSSGFLGLFPNSETTDAVVHVTIDNLSGVLLGAATTASMSNIHQAETFSSWRVDATSLALKENGDLVLTAHTSVTGTGNAEFYAFYYYVSAKVVLDEASISGTIRWPKTLATPVGSPLFVITANTKVTPQPPPGGFAIETFHVEATGVEGPVDAADATFYFVTYRITGALLGKSLTVLVNIAPGRLNPAPDFRFGQLVVAQIGGPNPVQLTTTNRHATNVDFEVRFLAAPK